MKLPVRATHLPAAATGASEARSGSDHDEVWQSFSTRPGGTGRAEGDPSTPPRVGE